MHDLDWDLLRSFLVVYREGSFSAAARRSGVQQSTLSRRVAELEERLGGPLFHRSRTGLVASERAHVILGAVEQMEAQAREALELATRLDDRVEGRVRLAVSEGIAESLIGPRLPGLLRAHPGLQVELVVGQAVVDLGGQEADLALRLVAPADPNLVAQKLGELDYAVLGAVDWIKVPVGDLAWVELVAPNTGLGAWHVENAGRVVLRTSSYAALVAAVRAGVGVALMSRGVRLSLPELVVHPGSFRLPPPLPLWRVASPASRSLRRVAVVWEALGGWVREMVAGGAGPREKGGPGRQQG